MSEPLWVVASGAAAARWTQALAWTRGAVVPLPWSEIVRVCGADGIRAALERVGPDLVLLTSPNGLLETSGERPALPEGLGAGYAAACVGNLTASAARALGFSVRHVGTGTGADLARALIAAGGPGRILFLRGDVVRREGPDLLEAAGWRVEELVTYEARPRSAFPRRSPRPPSRRPSSWAARGRPRPWPGRSRRRVARRFARRPAVAVGRTTAGRLRDLAFENVHVADEAGVGGIQRALGLALRGDASA